MYSVMLVDNESAIPRGLMQLIDWNRCGCRVTAVACDGADAIRQIRQSVPDILISDIRMPELSGLELCAWVREQKLNIQLILLTGFPDFEYAQQAIQYQVVDFVLKPTSEEALTAAVRKACDRIEKERGGEDSQRSLRLEQQLLLSELIFKSRHSLLYTVNRLNDLHMALTSYFVLCLNVFTRNTAADPDALLKQAQEILARFCGERGLYFVPKSDDGCYAVVCLPEDHDPFPLCTAATGACDEETDFVLTIGISRRHRNPVNLRLAAQEADDAQQFTLYSSQPSVMRCEDLPTMSPDAAQEILEKLRLVESSLENRSPEAVERHLNSFLACFAVHQVPLSIMYRSVLLLYNFCVSLLMSYSVDSGGLPRELAELQGQTPEELESELRRFTAETLSRISRTPGNIDRIIYDVKEYIDRNYRQGLSLDSLSAQVHLSPSYLSKLFKKEMGENLSTYILATRIEQAKLLLSTTDKKAYEIAEAVGIYDPVYFSKIFKKATGLKPKEYREQSGPDASRQS
jgi:two-component system response regulator YesN